MEITFSYAGRIGGMGQGYISGNIALASIKANSLYQLFACSFDEGLAKAAGESFKIKVLNEFTMLHGFLPRLLDRLGLTYYFSNLSFDKKVARIVKRCDIFHGFAAQSVESMIKAKQNGAKVVADNPNTHPLNIRNVLAEEYKIWKVPYNAYNKIALNRRLHALEIADRILVLSRTSYQTFIEHGYAEKQLRIVPYGVDSELFMPRPKNDHTFRVLFIGQVCLRKGFQYLLEAWKLLKLSQAELVLVGGLKSEAVYALKKYENEIDFKLAGPLDDMESIASIYNQASVAVFPSLEEGFGMVVTEAMASGLPVIVSENVGAKDLIKNREEGFIVPIRSAKAIKDAIEFLYENEDKRKEMGRNARKKIENQTWERYQDKLMNVYKELLGL